ncbi:hypothetical protein [Streptomyces shenzhenensis]|uniref:hypothetical protein n=1 Tax=Streptomyces shenzhenensis TaxID=943815 RepID=UPI0011C3CB44|nr:hypothetical protein [Streptomyces shenzhenensis]
MGKVIGLGCGGLLGLFVVVLIIGAVVGGGDDGKPESKPTSVSAEDKAKAREAAGLPAEPSAEARKAFLDALNAIDARIIKPGKDDQAVSRGLNQCSSVKSSPDDTEGLAKSALGRFTIDTRFPEINTQETGKKIVDAVRKHLCPDF